LIVVVDYGVGNLGSIMNMFRRIGVPAERSSETARIAAASKLVLPGVGAFDRGMESIQRRGLRGVLEDRVLGASVPVLGVCLGMQLMARVSEEGNEPGLGWIAGRVVRLQPAPDAIGRRPKVPFMGWNYVAVTKPHPLVQELGDDPRFYFVHSYHLTCDDAEDVLLHSYFGGSPFVAGVARGNCVGTQFHPEKSHRFGMALLRNFAAWAPAAAPVPARCSR
jgi:imidazole glycerol-phosphate synthase subunit HisH